MVGYLSWGLYPLAEHQEVRRLFWRHEPLPVPPDGKTALPRGLGRSYGDSCLNDGGVLLDATGLDRFLAFDRDAGVLRCEGGVSLAAVLHLAVPCGWFLPVTPGTKFVTVAGALANDIHGKNHHRAGTFGCHVTRFELLRSDGERIVCSSESNAGLFRATIGGLGLTGLVTWAEFRLKRVPSDQIDVESVRFANVDEFFELTAESDRDFEYTVAWVDCLATGHALGRGLLLRGNHAARGATPSPARRPGPGFRVPVHVPRFLLNAATIRAFNTLYYWRQRRRIVRRVVHYEAFFYPLDRIGNWNLLYGHGGFFQYQCVVPPGVAREATRELMALVAERGQGSFLAVLKVFGDVLSPGLLSFPRPGATLALDFANRGPRTLALLDELDGLVRRYGGRVYPAKDARMSPESFRAYFPEWRELAQFVDPLFSSGFWRRVTGEAPQGSARCPSAS